MDDLIRETIMPKPADDEAPEPEQRGSSLDALGAGDEHDPQRSKDNARAADPLGDAVNGRR